MAYTLGQAAKAIGRSKPTLSRAIKAGRLSATRNADGTYSIDPAELHRVFPPVPPDTGTTHRIETGGETPALQRENQLLREVVDDLRRRLDQAEEERRRLTMMVTDRRPWWRRWFR